MFDFLNLPSELRHEIYKLVLIKNSGTGPIMDSRNTIVLKDPPAWLWYRNIGGLALLRTCRQINQEARVVLYSNSHFYVDKGAGYFRMNFLPMIGGNAAFVKDLHFDVPGSWVGELCDVYGVRPRGGGGLVNGSSSASNGSLKALLHRRMNVQPEVQGTEIGLLLDCLVRKMPALRNLTFRVDAMLFSVNPGRIMSLLDPKDTDSAKLDEVLFDPNQFCMLWLAATCIDRHLRLEFASGTEIRQTTEFWGGVRDSGERVSITLDLVAQRDVEGRAMLEVEGWKRPVKVSNMSAEKTPLSGD
jgi:hypothetical protein